VSRYDDMPEAALAAHQWARAADNHARTLAASISEATEHEPRERAVQLGELAGRMALMWAQVGKLLPEQLTVPDICADRAPSFGMGSDVPDCCRLPLGHRDVWHQGENGMKWSQTAAGPTKDVCGNKGAPADPHQPCTVPLGHDLHRDADGYAWLTASGPVLDRTAIRNVILFVASATGHPAPEFVDTLTDRLWAKTGHAEPEPPLAPTRPATDGLTPFDLHGPGRCWHGPDCRGQWQEKDRHA
jgi:hypothetical protein